jgi:molybdopterin converting factor small subunit
MIEDIDRILLREFEIQARVEELALQIARDYEGQDLTIVALLHGSVFFLADLIRHIPQPVQFACVRVSSYDGAQSSGVVQVEDGGIPDVSNRHLLLLDDILDTGRTLHTLRGLRLSDQGGLLRIRDRERLCRRLRTGLSRSLSQSSLYRYIKGERHRMKIKVEFYSVLRDTVTKTPEWTVDLKVGDTIQALLEKLFGQFPALREWDNKLLIAANLDYVEREHVVQENETISVMPPVQGG